jgi:hypothetical protein
MLIVGIKGISKPSNSVCNKVLKKNLQLATKQLTNTIKLMKVQSFTEFIGSELIKLSRLTSGRRATKPHQMLYYKRRDDELSATVLSKKRRVGGLYMCCALAHR